MSCCILVKLGHSPALAYFLLTTFPTFGWDFFFVFTDRMCPFCSSLFEAGREERMRMKREGKRKRKTSYCWFTLNVYSRRAAAGLKLGAGTEWSSSCLSSRVFVFKKRPIDTHRTLHIDIAMQSRKKNVSLTLFFPVFKLWTSKSDVTQQSVVICESGAGVGMAAWFSGRMDGPATHRVLFPHPCFSRSWRPKGLRNPK